MFGRWVEDSILDAQTAMYRAVQAADDFAAELAAQWADFVEVSARA